VKFMTVVSVTIPRDLLRKFDEFMKTRGYYSRSEAFRDAIRSLMAEADLVRMESGSVVATIMMTCEYARKDVDLKMTELRHEYDDVVIENVHRHIGEKYCLEIFIAEGNSNRILDLVGRIRGMRGIQQVKAMFMPL
jgi:CopG family nickel-responsive transcriptional regulator